LTEIKSPTININDFLNELNESFIIDVRSPGEFLKGHIPGAVNIPLFDDNERAEIGIIYKFSGKENAVTRGLELVSPKLSQLVNETRKISQNKKIIVHCWRGGMRSQSFSWLMNTSGLNARVLEGGYKSYRNCVLKFFETKLNLKILGGPTGSGKSAILKQLANSGEQVVDLERLAHHKGSAFGSINEQSQNPQQLFEHELFNAFRTLDLKKPIWLEDEAMAIGWNKIPYPLWKQMKIAPIFKINVPFEERVKRLVSDYKTTNHELLDRALSAIKEKLGGQNYLLATECLRNEDLAGVASITLKYYDKAYEFNHEKRELKNIYQISTLTGDEIQNCQKVWMFVRNFNSTSTSL
jgi:tRNA 2-selenouridine synthase